MNGRTDCGRTDVGTVEVALWIRARSFQKFLTRKIEQSTTTMCVVSVFYCIDCDRYDPIPLRPSKIKKSMKQSPVVTVESVICLFSDCARRRQIFAQGKSFGPRSCLDCCYPFCTQDTCRLNVVSRSCRGRWQHDSENILPVQLVVKMAGESFQCFAKFSLSRSCKQSD